MAPEKPRTKPAAPTPSQQAGASQAAAAKAAGPGATRNQTGSIQALEHIQQFEEESRVLGNLRQFLRDSPFWVVSAGIHVGVFLILALFIMAPPQKKRPAVILNVEPVEITKEIQPLRKEENLAEDTRAASPASAFQTSETLQQAMENTKDVQVDPIDAMGIMSPMKAGKQSDFDGLGTDNGLSLVGTGASDLAGAVDQFAIETLNSIARGPTIVILLIDESRSIVNKDLPIITARMEHYFKQIRLNLQPQFMSRGRWAVYSYGQKFAERGPASSDLEATKKALSSIQPDDSGDENVVAALNAALDQYGGKAKFILVAALTDERGTDVDNDSLLESTIAKMRRFNARFFVFGREAVFCSRKKDVEITIGGKKFTNQADCGPEAPGIELWQRGFLWGTDVRNIPSGFGMFELNRMVLATDGIYFLLEPESDYDEKRLYAMYPPDVCSTRQYAALMSQTPIRRLLKSVWESMDKMEVPTDLRSDDVIDKAIGQAKNYRNWCSQEAASLYQMYTGKPQEERHWMRWVAHAQVTTAELLRRKYELGQYIECLEEVKRQAKAIPSGKRITLERSGQARGGRAAVQELETTKKVMEDAYAAHVKTPWAELLKRMTTTLVPGMDAKLGDIPKPQPHTKQPGPPPV